MRLLLTIVTLLLSVTGYAGERFDNDRITVGAARADLYLPLLKGKRVGLLSNHTGIVGDRHTLDLLLENGVDVRRLFSPEHGFRGTADAGEKVAGGRDSKTGLPIVSLYGKSKLPADSSLEDLDVIVCDIQDVGLRFYTYYITMLDMMNAAARLGKEFVVMDRPNPNGMYVDGPILQKELYSGVGRLPIPVVHGLTLGELARMIVGEKWLDDGRQLDLTVIPCEGYTHQSRYRLPVNPSPNLKDMKAVYLYPSTCLFEGTVMSLGRGTDYPFEIFGHPAMHHGDLTFTPRSMPGAKKPPLLGKRCRGYDLRSLSDDQIIADGINLDYVIRAYNDPGMKPYRQKFFTNFFDLLIGNRDVARQIRRGRSSQQIRATWLPALRHFRHLRAPYLLYPE